MGRSVQALAFVALLSVAGAERSLFAHKPNGGSSLHGLFSWTTNFGTNAPVFTATHTTTGYFTSNGNGSWVPVLSGLLGQTNSAYSTAAENKGVTSTAGSVAQAGLTFSGIQSVAFPSKLLGIAVGLNAASATVPSVLVTFDQGLTWLAVTGFAGTLPANPAGVNDGVHVNSLAPDLMSVACASRSLCWAAGGYFPSSTTTFNAALLYGDSVKAAVNPTPFANQAAAAGAGATAQGLAGAVFANTGAATGPVAGKVPTAGMILVSTNGGTFWRYVWLPSMGAFQAIAADNSGRHVYAVGHPYFKINAPGTAGPTGSQNAAFTSAVAAGSIAYSGSYGLNGTWVGQTAPAIPNYYYALNGVSVLRGTTAFAVGGNPFGDTGNGFLPLCGLGIATTGTSCWDVPSTPNAVVNNGVNLPIAITGLASNGILLGTTNGGFSWLMQPLPSWSVPNGNGNNFNFLSQGNGTLPTLYSVASYSTGGNYYVWAVGAAGYVVKSTFAASSINTGVYSTPISTWTGVAIAQAMPATAYLDLYGITWDNNNVGYIWGDTLILSTHNAGQTWQVETPNNVVINSNIVQAFATAPTTY